MVSLSRILNSERRLETRGDEWLRMSYPSKVTLLGSQQAKYLTISKHNLMFLYTIFLVSTKITMMLTETSVTLAPFEDILSQMLFGWQYQFSLYEKKCGAKSSSNGTGSSDNVKRKHTKKTE